MYGLISVMDTLEQNHGARYLQKVDFPGSWELAFKRLFIHNKKSESAKGKLRVVKSDAAQEVVIPENSKVTIGGKMDKQVGLPLCAGITEKCDNSSTILGESCTYTCQF